MAKKPPYVPDTPRETLEKYRRHLKSKAGEPDLAKAELIPTWTPGKAPGSEAMEQAELGDYTLYAARTTEAMHKQAPPGASRISWSIASEVSDSIICGGAAASMEEAKEYAYLVNQFASPLLGRVAGFLMSPLDGFTGPSASLVQVRGCREVFQAA